jgi:hypothetical protein
MKTLRASVRSVLSVSQWFRGGLPPGVHPPASGLWRERKSAAEPGQSQGHDRGHGLPPPGRGGGEVGGGIGITEALRWMKTLRASVRSVSSVGQWFQEGGERCYSEPESFTLFRINSGGEACPELVLSAVEGPSRRESRPSDETTRFFGLRPQNDKPSLYHPLRKRTGRWH